MCNHNRFKAYFNSAQTEIVTICLDECGEALDVLPVADATEAEIKAAAVFPFIIGTVKPVNEQLSDVPF
jgi:hypothetical protein